MLRKKWTQPWRAGLVHLYSLYLQHLLAPYRAHGEVSASGKPHRNRSSSRKSLALIPEREQTMAKLMSSSQKSATRRRQSISSKTCLILTLARRNLSAAWTHHLELNGIPALDSRGALCQKLPRRLAVVVTRSLCFADGPSADGQRYHPSGEIAMSFRLTAYAAYLHFCVNSSSTTLLVREYHCSSQDLMIAATLVVMSRRRGVSIPLGLLHARHDDADQCRKCRLQFI